ncbi:uncharacterized protein LOC107611808 isoform X2 [Arachis ipaensis]|uniref:uncharacterized protein LOC107611808 isoform X2 n=1 Tax=Arachis ipaensis TaxID=130454 RepID=UPI000A2B66ED|nr:uncharacterized protein LOC107611808 isoform X2 [Arachis ipaensis]XP_020964891.1 uncharacterized protein LOC107611808 isoform X2 [Arachis ipaensis]XP_020964892.1 uncharacterized protein LOC107611808 isoform X2 [Arachis ipaensis]
MEELDAAESKRRKIEKVEMAKEACLCLMTYKKLIVIKLSNLKEEIDVKDWTCLPPPPFEMFLDLPDHDMCPFEFDSKIYMAPSERTSLPPEIGRSKSVSMGNLVPWPIYEVKFEEGRIAPTGSLDGAPFPFQESYIANTPGSGDVYFYINLRRPVKDSSRFYVLCSGSRVWKPLNGSWGHQQRTRCREYHVRSRQQPLFLSSTERDSWQWPMSYYLFPTHFRVPSRSWQQQLHRLPYTWVCDGTSLYTFGTSSSVRFSSEQPPGFPGQRSTAIKSWICYKRRMRLY